MTYLQFLILFTLAPIAVLLAVLRGRVPRATWRLALVLALIAFAYTAPWDNLIVLNRVWSYSRRQVLGLVIGVVPLEEYLFYALQVVATVLFCAWIGRWAMGDGRRKGDSNQERKLSSGGKGFLILRRARRSTPVRGTDSPSIAHRPSPTD